MNSCIVTVSANYNTMGFCLDVTKNITELLQSSYYGALTRAQNSKNYKKGISIIKILLSSLKPNNHNL